MAEARTTTKFDIYQHVTDTILAEIEKGCAPWLQPWTGARAALALPKRVTDAPADRPLTALCEPTRCPNACIAEHHRPVWERSADDARALLREKRLPGLQRAALQQEVDRIEGVLARIAPEGTAPPVWAAVKGEGAWDRGE